VNGAVNEGAVNEGAVNEGAVNEGGAHEGRARRIAEGTVGNTTLREAMSTFAAATVRLAAVDATTTEIVRVRCAKHHDCGT
jgi:hypothetical protein